MVISSLNCTIRPHTGHFESHITTTFIFLLTKCEGRTGKYWPGIVALWTEHSKAHPYPSNSHYIAVRPGLFIKFVSFRKQQKYTAFDGFHGNSLYGKIPTKKEPIRRLDLLKDYLA